MPKKAAEPKKPAAKKAAPTTAKKTIEKKKDAPAAKKAAAPKTTKVAPQKKTASKVSSGKNILELGLLLDCTSSMGSWIERSKSTLIEIMNNVKASCDGQLDIRVAFIGYRDHCDAERFTVKSFTENIEEMRDFIAKVNA